MKIEIKNITFKRIFGFLGTIQWSLKHTKSVES
jgi:hypothetical protein